MKNILKLFLITLLGSFVMTTAKNAEAQETASAPENILILELTTGPVKIAMYPDKAPAHVERIKKLAREGFYNNIVFHRVIDGFMAQTGDPTGTGTGGSDYPDLPAEFNDLNFDRGSVGMARTNDPNSANSQFFICFDDCSFLNGQYTVWGKVIEGMENVDRVARGEPPANPDMIVKAYISSDKSVESSAPASEDKPLPNSTTSESTASPADKTVEDSQTSDPSATSSEGPAPEETGEKELTPSSGSSSENKE